MCLLLLLTSFVGCGGATVPCPTPLADLDRHRDEAEQAEALATQAEEEAREADAAKVEAARRLAALRASADSLRAAATPAGKPAR